MKRIILIALAASLFWVAAAQKNPPVTQVSSAIAGESALKTTEQPELKIYPVPVKENNFHVTSEKEISMIKVTNIIGQEVYRTKYSSPVLTTQVFLTNTQRGMYLVTVLFTDNTRTVRKIMVEAVQ